ncbi:ATP-dependent DNA helicase [Bowdeniella massiliensis]|uniref:ATP-dependent DNA helicase n=1 Tax=Bowdeniella massiliensis TaxID=2932264 RepID=UPI002027826B|nr:ATP-dependent DNA helicase [Bowdeniella massiliensis]
MSDRISKPGSVAALARELGQKFAPTPEQERVIDYPLAPLLVVAGAGSGKTTTMAMRVAHLVHEGAVRADQVLGLTFTRKATSQLSRNVRGLLAKLEHATLIEQPEIATYNSFAGAVARDFSLRLGENPDAQLITDGHASQIMIDIVEAAGGDYSLFDKSVESIAGNARSLAAQIRDNLMTPEQARTGLVSYAHACAELFAPKKQAAKIHTDLEHAVQRRLPDEVRELLKRAQSLETCGATFLRDQAKRLLLIDFVAEYDKRKKDLGVIEFADQTAIAAAVAEIPDVQRIMRERYRLVLLDEFQDTSVPQLEFLLRLFGPDHPITAVGDPNQAIYGWRGASAQALADFQQRFSTTPPVTTLPLNTSFRNDREILSLANHVAIPLQLSTGEVTVPSLAAADHADDGQIAVSLAPDIGSEGEQIVRTVNALWQPGKGETIAVLCRTRRHLGTVAMALAEADIPHEVVGLSGLLSTPEVADLRALLDVAADASRGEAAGRLLTRARLGTADIHVLSSWARELDEREKQRAIATGGADQRPLATTLVEVLNSLPPESFTTPEGHRLSETARARLIELGEAIRTVRGATGSHLEDLVATAERALRLDIDLLARPGAPGLSARRNLDRFRQVARSFVAVLPEDSTLAAFLSWLRVADAEERGLDQEAEVIVEDAAQSEGTEHLAVQLMTMHAAKGLEFDHVIVAGLAEGTFPSHQAKNGQYDVNGRSWLTDAAALPWRLRKDHDSLPEFTGEVNSVTPAQSDDTPMGAFLAEEGSKRLGGFKKAAGAYQLQEERRLAYVAFTRAKHTLTLTSSWRHGGTAKKYPSRFLREALPADHPLLGSSDDGDNPGAIVSEWLTVRTATRALPGAAWWTAGSTATGFGTLNRLSGRYGELELQIVAEEPEDEPDESRELTDDTDAPSYPATDVALHRRPHLQRAAAAVRAAPQRADAPAPSPASARLIAEADLLLADLAARRSAPEILIEAPGRLSATQVGEVSDDAAGYLTYLRRPLPTPPSTVARLGTEFHRWVQDYYTGESELALDLDTATEPAPPQLAAWRETFLASRFAAMQPIIVEEAMALTLPVGGRSIQIHCKIDAAFDTSDGILIVDWKTGRPPRDEQTLAVRSLQLQIYRYALAASRGIDPERITACFYYVGSNQEIRGIPLTRDDIAERLAVLDPVGRSEALGSELLGTERGETS